MAAATTARMSRVRRTERLHFAAGLRLPSACRSSGTRTSGRTVDREWLERRLSNGLSVDAIAADAGCSASSVGYWINHFGLWPPQRAQSGRGGLEADELRSLVQQGLSVRQMAAACGVSATTIRRWLRRHDLRTSPSRYARRDGPKPHEILRECPTHGWTAFRRVGRVGGYRCARCSTARVSLRRRRVRELLVAEAGGSCTLCGYDRYSGALQFHHLEPREKRFHISEGGLTRSLARLREEAGKCLLLCANCHAEVEAGITALPPPLRSIDPG